MMLISRIHIKVFFVLSLFLFSGLLHAQSKTAVARSEWMKGYVKLENADKAVQEENKLAALQLYREAVLVFEAVRRQYPQWNPSLLNYRIKYCQEKITELDKSVQSEAEEMSRENLLDLSAKQAQLLHDNSMKIQQLNTSVSILSESLQRARTEAAKNAAAEADFGNLQSARQELENRCRLLQSKLSKAEDDIGLLRKQVEDKNVAQKLREENRQQSEQLKESTRQIELLEGNLKNVRLELEKSQMDYERQLRTGKEYEKRLQEASKRVIELTEFLNTLHVDHNALKLKSQQQDVEINFQKENNTRLNNEKTELQAEVLQLRNIRDKFATTQDANQALQTQIIDYENRLKESLEKSRFEGQKHTQQITQLQERLEKTQNEVQTRDQQVFQYEATLKTTQDKLQTTAEALATLKADHLVMQERHKEAMVQQRQEITASQMEVANLKKQLYNEQETRKEKTQELKLIKTEVNRLQQALAAEQKSPQESLVSRQAELKLSGAPLEEDASLTAKQKEQELLLAKTECERLRQELAGRLQSPEAEKNAQTNAELQRLRQQVARHEEQLPILKQNLELAVSAKEKAIQTVQEQTQNLAAAEKRAAEEKLERERLAKALRQAEENRQALANQLQADTEKTQLQQEYIALQTSHLELKSLLEKKEEGLKTAQKEWQELSQNLKQSQDYGLTLEKQIQQLRETQKVFTDISKQLQSKDELLNNRNTQLQVQAERLAASNAVVLMKTDEVNSSKVELQGVKRKVADLEVLNGRLNEQLNNVIRRQADFDKENIELKARLLEEKKQLTELHQQLGKKQQELEAKTVLSIRLEKSISELERQRDELTKQHTDEQQKLKLLQEDLGSSKTKSAAVDGLTSNLIDLQTQLKIRSQELDKLKNDLQAGQTQISVLDEQLKRRDEQVKEIMTGKDAQSERTWLNRLADLNSKLEQEENRRKALEIALIQKEAESRKTGALTAPATSPVLTVAAGASQASSGNRTYSENEVLINGFLRQALDAEKNQKTEAAQWNYQKVLELQPDNSIALKRLGLIAANNGNDDDTVKYLKLAFRYDPDDADVLLALGFAMINLQQPEWAFSYLGRAVALEPANPTLSRLFGGALVDLGWTQAAENQFAKALQLNPKDPHSAFNLAVLCATANPPRLDEAKKWYEQAVKNGAEKDPRFEAAFK